MGVNLKEYFEAEKLLSRHPTSFKWRTQPQETRSCDGSSGEPLSWLKDKLKMAYLRAH
jgi:hypothetical protein